MAGYPNNLLCRLTQAHSTLILIRYLTLSPCLSCENVINLQHFKIQLLLYFHSNNKSIICISFSHSRQMFLWPLMQAKDKKRPAGILNAGPSLLRFKMNFVKEHLEHLESESQAFYLFICDLTCSLRMPQRGAAWGK